MLPSIVIFLCVGLLPAVLCFDGLQGQSIKDAFGEFSLTDMISVQSQGIEYEEADDGFPSYKFFSTSDVKSSYRVLLPEKLYEFAILVKFLPNSPKGGYLFSVVNPLDTVVQLGLHLSPVIKNVWNVSLLYTQSDQNSISRKLVSYQLPYRGKEWTTLSFQVLGDKVLFYYDCELNKTTSVVREPQELVFDSASTLYLAQAGLILTGHFELAFHHWRFRTKEQSYLLIITAAPKKRTPTKAIQCEVTCQKILVFTLSASGVEREGDTEGGAPRF
ncbi:uncharacterized protein LOC129241945 [Anastrepha obliqua]|uniref:uncharacterized protein LOC129241945 n=1 Tax=Anastrepha obliqua TaxID=95512 RepID=UPI00240A4F08|nr:uncharacterized protein LOC129241945 [Anastrepha obliqua]